MALTLETNEITGWTVAKLVVSSLTLFLSICYIFINRIYKRGVITRSVFISALASLVSVAIVFGHETNNSIELSALFILRGIQYAFAFHPVLYAFHRNIVRVNGEDKSLVYIGYIWMVVTLGVSFAATLMLNNSRWKYSSSYPISEHAYNVVAMTMLSSWGFIAVIILLYARNKKLLKEGSETSVIIFIYLTLIQVITTTVLSYANVGYVHPAIVLVLIDLTMHIAIIIAACYGPVWIRDELKKKIVHVNSRDLEAS